MSARAKYFIVALNCFLLLFILVANIQISGIQKARVNANDKVVLKAPSPREQQTVKSNAFAEIMNETEVLSASQSAELLKDEYTLVVIGDSMVETMGKNLDYLDERLTEKYPEIKFELYNYGVGGGKVDKAKYYFDQPFSENGKSLPAITTLEPDVIILGSFAYNPFEKHNRDLHWLEYAGLIEKAKSLTENVYVLTEIAPLEDEFGKGPGGIVWSEDYADRHVLNILEQMENAFGLAKEYELAVIDVYTSSLKEESSRYGKAEYVDDHDGIHPSEEGHTLTAEKIVESIKLDLNETSSESPDNDE